MFVRSPYLGSNGTRISGVAYATARHGTRLGAFSQSTFDNPPGSITGYEESGYRSRNFMQASPLRTPTRYTSVAYRCTFSSAHYCFVGTDRLGRTIRFYFKGKLPSQYSGNSFRRSSTVLNASGVPYDGLSIASSLANNLRIAVLAEAANNTQLQLANSFLEAGRSADMIVNRVITFYQASRLARKGRFRDAGKVLTGGQGLDHAANSWLELQYGWRPLLSDIYNLTQVANNGLRRDAVFVRKGSREEFEVPTYASVASRTGKAYAFANAGLSAKIRSSKLDAMANLGLLNPAAIAWEAVPYSFVFDWFVPVGNWLQGMNAPFTMDFVSGFYNYGVSVDITDSLVLSTGGNNPRASECTAELGEAIRRKYEVAAVYRHPETAIPRLVPRFHPRLNRDRLLSAIALINQRF